MESRGFRNLFVLFVLYFFSKSLCLSNLKTNTKKKNNKKEQKQNTH